MKQEQFGAMITEGPQPWAIVQQADGYAAIALSGVWAPADEKALREAQVYARVVREDDASIVVPWQACAMGEGRTWTGTIADIPAGGLYRIETCLQINGNGDTEWALRGDMIHHVGVGDLYVIAGQSNAAGYGRGPHTDTPELGVHLLRNNGRWDLATHPFNESSDTIHVENRETANPGHSPYLAFAKLVKRATGYPIGLIQTALGGSPLKSWNPQESGVLYRNMMNIVRAAGGKVRGILWYQGCSDCNPDESVTYLERFRHVVACWRSDLGDPELAVFTVQLNRHTRATGSDESDRSWGRVREAQRQAIASIPHVYAIPALDCPLSDLIHNSPAGNMTIGERVAKAVLANVYGQPVPYRAPNIAEASYGMVDAEGRRTIRLKFADVHGYLVLIGALHERLFTVEDTRGRVGVEEWHIVGTDEIALTLAREPIGAARVHAAYEANPPASYLPVDSGTYMPMFAFYDVPVV